MAISEGGFSGGGGYSGGYGGGSSSPSGTAAGTYNIGGRENVGGGLGSALSWVNGDTSAPSWIFDGMEGAQLMQLGTPGAQPTYAPPQLFDESGQNAVDINQIIGLIGNVLQATPTQAPMAGNAGPVVARGTGTSSPGQLSPGGGGAPVPVQTNPQDGTDPMERPWTRFGRVAPRLWM